MKKYYKNYQGYVLALVSGIITGLAFSFDNLSLVIWVGFIPLIIAIHRSTKNYKTYFKIALTFGVSYYLIILHWIFNLYPLDWMDINKRDSILILTIGWILISLIEGLVIATILGVYSFIKSKNLLVNVISLSFLWVIIEWSQGIGQLGFPWGRLAVSQANILPVVQSVSLFGSLFIGFIIILVNGMVANSLLNYKQSRKVINKYLLIACGVFLINLLFGICNINKNTNDKEVPITLVQGNIPTAQKWKTGDSKEHFRIYKSLSEEALENGKSKILFWPETAIPMNLTYSQWLKEEYIDMAINNNITFITGAFHSEKNEGKDYNSIYFINESGEIGQQYLKRQLVPFGEILPFKEAIYKILPILEEANLFNGDLAQGSEAVIYKSTYGNIGSVICFESIFPKLVREAVNNGAEIIFVATNDSWFRDSRAVYQHNYNSVLRAIEANRYVVRAANTGISSVIDNKGNIIESIEPLARGYINTNVKFINNKTLYMILGDILVVFAFIWLAIIKALIIKRKI